MFVVKIIEDSNSKGSDRRDKKDKEDVVKGPPPEVGIIYRHVHLTLEDSSDSSVM